MWSFPATCLCRARLPDIFQSLPCPSASSLAPSAMAATTTKGKPLVDRAVIVGGGLGGLSAALQLRKVGIDAQVYEKNPTISGGEGTLITVFPNGCKALNEGDSEVVQKIRLSGMVNAPAIIVDLEGKKIGEWNLSTQMEGKFGQPSIAILWQDALKILAEAVPEYCKHTGYECFDVTQEEDGAVAHFKNGNETFSIKAPLVIGADGIRSVVRRALFGHIPPQDNGRTMWRAVIDSHHCSHEALKTNGAFASVSNGRTVFIVNGVQDKIYWAMSLQDEVCEGTSKVRSKNKEEAKERLLDYFKGWSFATALILATEPDLILERRILDMPVLSSWSKGSIVLLGGPLFLYMKECKCPVQRECQSYLKKEPLGHLTTFMSGSIMFRCLPKHPGNFFQSQKQGV